MALVMVRIDLFYAVQTVDAWCLETGQADIRACRPWLRPSLVTRREVAGCCPGASTLGRLRA